MNITYIRCSQCFRETHKANAVHYYSSGHTFCSKECERKWKEMMNKLKLLGGIKDA